MNSQQRLEIAALESIQGLAAGDRVGLLAIDPELVGRFIRLGERLWLLADQAPLQVVAELTEVSGPSREAQAIDELLGSQRRGVVAVAAHWCEDFIDGCLA